ncbi:MAG: hypothetical protein KGL13_02275 [Gammaproteobacteria bacterium]|nr:hypothetical protein [Gammaproteobacteria bacterium]MDE2345273.1 hypothetical protein [Gammaproteobacteria bacterium]
MPANAEALIAGFPEPAVSELAKVLQYLNLPGQFHFRRHFTGIRKSAQK